jgi:glycosyltransferase involved in cell wall biosynthesis
VNHNSKSEDRLKPDQNLSEVSDLNPKPIHVLHIIDKLSVEGSGIHGVTRVLENWISNFDRNKFVFTIISLRAPEKASKIFERLNVPVHFLSRSKIDPRTIWDLLKISRRLNPDLLHLHGWGSTNFGRLLSFMTNTPNIVHEYAELVNQPIYQTVADWILSPLTDQALAVSRGVGDFMVSYRKINPKKLKVMHTGFPVDEFQIPDESEYLQERKVLGIQDDEKVVCKVGRLAPLKGHTYLLQAAVHVLKQCPNTKFLIVGEGPEREKLEAEAKDLGISEKVIFTGFHRDVSICLALSDIFAMVSLTEGMPITIFEAMNLKKPIVAFPAGGIRDIIRDSENGYLVPFKDVKQFSEKLIYLLDHPDFARKLGEKAWEDCQKYDISFAVEELEKEYLELFSRK